jgi:hypothetical protein
MPLADIATLKHLSQQGMGENTLRALASEFGFNDLIHRPGIGTSLGKAYMRKVK